MAAVILLHKWLVRNALRRSLRIIDVVIATYNNIAIMVMFLMTIVMDFTLLVHLVFMLTYHISDRFEDLKILVTNK